MDSGLKEQVGIETRTSLLSQRVPMSMRCSQSSKWPLSRRQRRSSLQMESHLTLKTTLHSPRRSRKSWTRKRKSSPLLLNQVIRSKREDHQEIALMPVSHANLLTLEQDSTESIQACQEPRTRSTTLKLENLKLMRQERRWPTVEPLDHSNARHQTKWP